MQVKKNIGVGIIGAGFIGELHIESLRRIPNVKVIALAEANKELAVTKAEQLNISKIYTDFQKLITDEDVDVTHIATPNYLHYEQVLFALKCNKHVICEKPLALNSNETAKLYELSKKIKVVNAVNFNCRFYPLVKVMKDMIKNGHLGEIYAVTGSFLQDWMIKESDYDWRADLKLGGKTQVVATIGSHWIDLVQYLVGLKIESVCADFQTVHKIRKRKTSDDKGNIHEEDVNVYSEDFANILFRFSNNIPGNVVFSHVSAGKRLELRIGIYGSKCSLEWNSEQPNHLSIGFRDKANQILIKDPNLVKSELRPYFSLPGGHIEGYADTFKQNFKSIYKNIYEERVSQKEQEFATIADGHDVQLVIDTAFESAMKRKWLKVDRNYEKQ